MKRVLVGLLTTVMFSTVMACTGSESGQVQGSGGSSASGGTASTTSQGSGGASPAGGADGDDASGNGGSSNTGDARASGGDGTSSAQAGSGGTTITSSGGGANAGGATSRGGATSTGGSSSKGGATTTGGRPSTGGVAATGGVPGTGGSSTSSSTCAPGSTTTTWANDCPTAPPTDCTPGTWIAGGPDPDHSGFKLLSESEHFAVYSDESPSGAQAAVDHLETVWKLYFGSPMYMREPLCTSSTKYKASVHVHSDWGLTGGSWGPGRMGMWIGTGGLSDHWGLAHEFMHGVQSVQGGMSCSRQNTCGWVYESHANWAAQQQVEYHTKDVHCSEYLANMPHLYLGSTRDRYCNWQFMEFLKDKYCFSAVNAIWTGTAADNPFTGIMNGMGWSLDQLNDFMGEWAMHNVTWDYQDPEPQGTAGGNQGKLYRSKYGLITDISQTTRRLRLTKVEPLNGDDASDRRFFSPYYWAPQRYGYNVVRLYPESGATSVTVTFRGVTAAQPSPDWRWGLVATDSGITTPRYSALQEGSDGQLTFCVNEGEALWLVVVATPSSPQTIVWDQAYGTVPRYPWMVQLANAWPDGFRDGAQDACPSGLARATQGGGCAPSGTSVYVGPYATVASGATVSGNARIEDHAFIESGSTVSGGTVGALSLVGNNRSGFKITSGTAKTTFYPLGFFEGGQGLSGGTLIGDVEYRGQGLSRASGTCSGFVDSSTCVAPGSDATPAPPYAWRE